MRPRSHRDWEIPKVIILIIQLFRVWAFRAFCCVFCSLQNFQDKPTESHKRRPCVRYLHPSMASKKKWGQMPRGDKSMPRKTSKNNTTGLGHSLFAARSFVGSLFFLLAMANLPTPPEKRSACKNCKKPRNLGSREAGHPPVAGVLIPACQCLGAALLDENSKPSN